MLRIITKVILNQLLLIIIKTITTTLIIKF